MARTLLLVEDDPNVRSVIASLLEAADSGHILVASNTDMALRLLATSVVDVLIADATLQHPHHGMELFAPAMANNPDVAILLMSAEPMSELGDLGSRVQYIRKPFGKQQLMTSISEAVALAQSLPSGTL